MFGKPGSWGVLRQRILGVAVSVVFVVDVLLSIVNFVSVWLLTFHGFGLHAHKFSMGNGEDVVCYSRAFVWDPEDFHVTVATGLFHCVDYFCVFASWIEVVDGQFFCFVAGFGAEALFEVVDAGEV